LDVAESVAVRLLKEDQSDQASKLAKEIKDGRKQAIPAFEKALQEKAVLEKIPLLLGQKKYSEAIRQYENILSLDPTYTKAKQGILETKDAWCLSFLEGIPGLLEKNDFPGARTRFNQAEKIGSRKTSELKKTQKQIEDSEAKHLIAQAVAFQERREFDKAKQSYEKATQAAPNFREAAAHLKKFSEFLEKKKSLESGIITARDGICLNECIKLLAQLEKHDPENVLLNEKEGLKKQIEEYNEILSRLRGIIDAHDGPGKTLTVEGERKLLDISAKHGDTLGKYDDPYCAIAAERVELARNRLRQLSEINEAIEGEKDRLVVKIWGECAQIMDRFEPVSAIKPQIRDAHERVSNVDSIIDASLKGDEEKIVELWNQCSEHHSFRIFSEEHADGLPIQERCLRAKELVAIVGGIKSVINEQEAHSKNGRLKTWENETNIVSKFKEHRDILANSSYALKRVGDRALLAKKLGEAFAGLKASCVTKSDRAAVKIWKEYGKPLSQYESVESLKPNIVDAETRVNAVDAIIQASLDSLEERIIHLWGGCPLLQDSVIAVTEKVGDQTIKDRYATAVTRAKATDEIIMVVKRQDNLSKSGQPITWENEAQILSIFEKYRNVLIDSIYVQKKLGNRVKQARDILQSYKNLRKASEEDNWLDIDEIWAENPLLHDLDHTQGKKEQFELIADAFRALKLFLRSYEATPSDDEKLIQIWDQSVRSRISKLGEATHPGLGNKSPNEFISNCKERINIKKYIFQELVRDPEDRDYVKISEIWKPKLCEAHPSFSGKLENIRDAVLKGQWIAFFLSSLERRDNAKVVKTWEDHKNWMGNHRTLRPYLSQIQDAIVEDHTCRTDQISKGVLHGIIQGIGGFTVDWEWPPNGPEECMVAAKEGTPPEKPAKPHAVLPTQSQQLINSTRFHASNGCHFPGSFKSPHVSVWPVVSFLKKKILIEGKKGGPFLSFSQKNITFEIAERLIPGTRALNIHNKSGSFTTPHLILSSQIPGDPGSLTVVLELGEIALDGQRPFTRKFSAISSKHTDYILKPKNDSDGDGLNIKHK
jgi:tetratricopeptide (TPR) repeat protein